jgi:hypothetical protein
MLEIGWSLGFRELLDGVSSYLTWRSGYRGGGSEMKHLNVDGSLRLTSSTLLTLIFEATPLMFVLSGQKVSECSADWEK